MTLAAELEWRALAAPSGLVGWSSAPARPRGGVLFLPGAGGAFVSGGHATRGLVASGFEVVVLGLGWRGGEPTTDADGGAIVAGSTPAVPPTLVDHEVIADLGAARSLLAVGPRFVIGVGSAGVYARVASCVGLGFVGVAAFGGPIWSAGTSTARPIQPLDLLPGRSCALQAHLDDGDADSPPEHIDELERRLGRVAQSWQVFRGRWRDVGAATAWGRATNLLLHLSAHG